MIYINNITPNLQLSGYQGREGKEDVQEKHGWKGYEQP